MKDYQYPPSPPPFREVKDDRSEGWSTKEAISMGIVAFIVLLTGLAWGLHVTLNKVEDARKIEADSIHTTTITGDVRKIENTQGDYLGSSYTYMIGRNRCFVHVDMHNTSRLHCIQLKQNTKGKRK